jgi:general secretion pathway protein M
MALANMNPVQSRRLAVGLLLVVLLAVIAAIAVPVWMLNRHYDAALAENADKLERYRRISATRPEAARQLEALRAKDTRRFFLRSGAPALSAAESQEAVRQLVESSGGRLVSLQPPTVKEEGRYRQVTVNVQITANVFAMRKILHAIESHTPYLFIDNLVVRSQVPGNFKPAPGGEPEMFLIFDISGYALTSA